MEEQKTPLEKGFLEPAEAEEMQDKQRQGKMGETINALGVIYKRATARSTHIKARIESVRARVIDLYAAREELLAKLEANGPDEEASPDFVEEYNRIKAETLKVEAEQAEIEAELAQAEKTLSDTETTLDEGINNTRAALVENALPLEEAFAKNEKAKTEWGAFKKGMGFPVNEPFPWAKLNAQNIFDVLTALLKIMLNEEVDKAIYLPILHAPGLDELAKLGRKTEIQKNPVTETSFVKAGNMTIQQKRGINIGPPAKRKAVRKEPSKTEEGLTKEKEAELAKEKEALLFQRYISTVATTAALKLLDISAIKLTEQNGYKASKFNTNVEMDVKEYMEKCGIPLTRPSLKKVKNTLKGILEAFNAITLDFPEKRAGKEGENWHLNILQKYEDNMANGKLKLQFTEDVTEYLVGAYLAYFPMLLLKADERNDNVYRMGRRLMYYYSNINNQQQGTADIISVKALLESAPAIPTYEEVMGADKHLELRIMRPFKAALDKLDFIEWEYCNAKKAPLTKKQKAAFSYETFIGCYVKFTVMNGPDMKRIVAARQEKKAQAEERKRARAEARKKKGDA